MRNRLKYTRYISIGIYLGIFVFMLVLNSMTLYIADDFTYSFSFWDHERMRSLSQLVMSMRAHRYSMNGRLVAHVLVQILAMLPMWFFDIINSLMFLMQVAFIQEIAGNRYPRSNAMLLAIFFTIWLTCPSFGSVILWQDGACNYLWSTVLALLFLFPYVQEFLTGKRIENRPVTILFLMLSFGMGAYSETSSAAAIGMAALLILLMVFWQKQKINKMWIWSMVMAVLGYLSIYTAPAQIREKAAEFTFSTLWNNFLYAKMMYEGICGGLLLIFILAFILNLWRRTDRKQQLLGLVFLCGSLAANFILVFAEYYVARSAMATVFFLITADAVLLYPLLQDKLFHGDKMFTAAVIALSVITAPALASGVSDIYDTYRVMKQNETYLYACADQGIREATVPIVNPRTDYSVASGLCYLEPETPDVWEMAKYYGLDVIYGVEEP